MRLRTLIVALAGLAALADPLAASAQRQGAAAPVSMEEGPEFTNDNVVVGTTDADRAAAAPASTQPRITCREGGLQREFPRAARIANVDTAVVRVRLNVDAHGRIRRAVPLADPGYGFAAAAVRVVMRHCSASPARNERGRAVAATLVFRVTFVLE